MQKIKKRKKIWAFLLLRWQLIFFFFNPIIVLAQNSVEELFDPKLIESIDSISCQMNQFIISPMMRACGNYASCPIPFGPLHPDILHYSACVGKICRTKKTHSTGESLKIAQKEAKNILKQTEVTIGKHLNSLLDNLEKDFAKAIDTIERNEYQAFAITDQHFIGVLSIYRYNNNIFYRHNINGNIQIDEKKSKEEITDGDRESIEWTISVIRRLIDIGWIQPLTDANYEAIPEIFLQEKFLNKVEIKDKTKSNHEKNELALTRLQANYINLLQRTSKNKIPDFGSYTKDEIEKSILLARTANKKGKPIQEFIDLADILRSFDLISLLDISNSDPIVNKLFQRLPKKILEANNPKFSKEKIQRIKEDLLLNTKNMKILRTQALHRCIAAYSFQLATLPSQQQIEDFQRKTPAYIAEINDLTKKYFSSHSAKIIQAELEKALFKFPKSKERFQSDFLLKIGKKQEKKYQYLFSINSLNELNTNPFISLDFYCTHSANLTYTDYKAYTSSGIPVIQVSAMSVTHPETGASTCKHELGHTLSQILHWHEKISTESKKKYKNIMECLSKQHKIPGSDFYSRIFNENTKSASYYNEEDFADLIEANLSGNHAENNFCSLLEEKFGGEKSWNIEYHEKENDPHSTNLFRLLHTENISTGFLPSECNAAVLEKEKRQPFRNCLDPKNHEQEQQLNPAEIYKDRP